jgi:glycosyltransferase involved in cell wall biosynthesis
MPGGHVSVDPIVSVVIPVYRASGDIAVALGSVFAQTFTHFEVIVVNDGSPDTPALEAALAPYRSRIRYITQPNQGAGAARNTAICASHGRYIAFLDADDRWTTDFLSRQIAWLEADPECDLVYSDALVSGDSPLAGRRFTDTAPSIGNVSLVSLIEQRCNIILSTVVMRREPLVDAGLFDETLRRGQDFELWLRLASRGASMRYQDLILAERRVRADGLSGDSIAELQRALNVLEHFGRAHDLAASARTALRARMTTLLDRLQIEQSKRRILEGNFAAARDHLSATRARPLKVRAVLLALRIAPRALRAAYLRLRPEVWHPPLPAAR